MSKFNQKDIVLVKFPFTDLTNYKVRPALIVSNALVNATEDVTVVMLTTQNVHSDFCETIGNTDVDTPFKAFTTMNVNCKKIAVLDKSIIHKKITECTNITKFNSIVDKIKSMF